jgi:hypothetical protein
MAVLVLQEACSLRNQATSLTVAMDSCKSKTLTVLLSGSKKEIQVVDPSIMTLLLKPAWMKDSLRSK